MNIIYWFRKTKLYIWLVQNGILLLAVVSFGGCISPSYYQRKVKEARLEEQARCETGLRVWLWRILK